MEANQKSNFSVVLSVIALLISGASIYLEFGRPIKLDLAVSRNAFISNTIGGIPDVNLYFTIRANGSSTRSVIVESVKVTLRNLQTKNTHILFNDPRDGGFPTVLQGGAIITHGLLFSVNDSIPEAVERYKTWYSALSGLVPKKKDQIEKMREQMKETFLPIKSDKTAPSSGERGNDNEGIASLLSEVSVEEFPKILFFVSGNYEMEIEVLDQSGKSLALHKREFSIEDVFSQTLRHRFNDNALVRTSAADSA